jgi:hypothetical protein
VKRILALALLLTVVAVAATGCGKKKPPTTTQWMNNLCTSITTWTDSLSSAAQSVTSGSATKDSLQSAAGDVQDATKTFADDLRSLGKPNTQAGAQAQQSLDSLSTKIDSNVKTIQTAIDNASGLSGVLTAISSVSATLAVMRDEVRSTYEQLTKLGASSELKQAFNSAQACAPLRNATS